MHVELTRGLVIDVQVMEKESNIVGIHIQTYTYKLFIIKLLCFEFSMILLQHQSVLQGVLIMFKVYAAFH